MADMPMAGASYLVFGMRRSGTHYLGKIINKNLKIRPVNYHLPKMYWKHHPTPPPLPHPTMVISKHPVMWIESIVCRNSVDMKKPRYIPTGKRDNFNGWSVQALAREWKGWHDAWAGVGYHVRYEDTLTDAGRARVVEYICDELDLPVPSPIIRPAKVSQSMHYRPAVDDAYYRGNTPRYLNRQQVRIIMDCIPEHSLKTTHRTWEDW